MASKVDITHGASRNQLGAPISAADLVTSGANATVKQVLVKLLDLRICHPKAFAYAAYPDRGRGSGEGSLRTAVLPPG